MRWTVLTLFPEAFQSALAAGLFGKAVEKGILEVDLINYRDYAEGRHKVVDDTPFGGGSGMVIKVEPVARALEELREKAPGVHVVLLTPQGALLNQAGVRRLGGHDHVALLCGRYEGVDERIRRLVDEELSIGDYVLSGGEPAAWNRSPRIPCWSIPSTPGPGSSTACRFPRFCCPGITRPSPAGAGGRRCGGRPAGGRSCWRVFR
jgi:tRNA (guanine-N1)-methyltransferase